MPIGHPQGGVMDDAVSRGRMPEADALGVEEKAWVTGAAGRRAHQSDNGSVFLTL